MMVSKDTLYFELRDALEAGGCAMCRQGRKAGDSYLDALIYEGVTDRELREELRASLGLCHRHAWRIAHRRGSVLGIAIIYQDVINRLLTELGRDESSAPRWLRPHRDLTQRLEPTTGCPACELESDAELRAGKTLLKHLGDVEIANRFQTAGGLCLPHYRAIVGEAGGKAGQILTGWQREAYQALHHELSELIRKHDYRFAGEAIGTEGSAWLRAVARVAGEYDTPMEE